MDYELERIQAASARGHGADGQREAFKTHPELKWQFTYWAHSEYLQLLAELGIFGAAALFAAGAWWLWSFARALTMRRALSPGAMWGCAMLFLCGAARCSS